MFSPSKMPGRGVLPGEEGASHAKGGARGNQAPAWRLRGKYRLGIVVGFAAFARPAASPVSAVQPVSTVPYPQTQPVVTPSLVTYGANVLDDTRAGDSMCRSRTSRTAR